MPDRSPRSPDQDIFLHTPPPDRLSAAPLLNRQKAAGKSLSPIPVIPVHFHTDKELASIYDKNCTI